MDYRVFFTQRALKDLAGIVSSIAEDDGEAAERFGNALLAHVELLGRFPRIGATIRKRSRVRKLVHSPVLVHYEVHANLRLVEVFHFRHGSRMPPRF